MSPDPDPAPNAAGKLPQAGRATHGFEAPAGMAPPATPAAEKPSRASALLQIIPSGAAYFVKSVLALLAMVAMIGGALWLMLSAHRARSPEVLVPQLAQRYLDALRSNDYATAYAMLSEDSKRACTLDEFRLSRDSAPWTWDDLSVSKVEPAVVVLQYDLTLEDRAALRDTLVFVKERANWARPYNRSLIKKADEAFQHNEPDLALIHSQQAVRLDPRDPLARASLCESVYACRLADEIEPACRTALAMAQSTPSPLSPKSLQRLRAILSAVPKR